MGQTAITECKQQISLSRDEMNLAEFPLTVLSTRANPGIKTLEFSDTVRGKNGEIITRQWVVTGADKFGLPTSSDDEVLLGLIKLTVQDGFKHRKIYFTRYELLKILRWTTEGRSYTRLQRALDRLSGVRIKATNAFYDNAAKLHSTKNFGIIDEYEINDGRDSNPRPSFFTWSEVIFDSFKVGFIKKLDLDFYLSLRSAISKRLYRYLDKHFWYKSRVELGLFVLAHEKVGISRNYRYVSSIRQQLDPAIEELIERGFVSRCEYVGKGKGTTIVLYASSRKANKGASRDRITLSKTNGRDNLPLKDKIFHELTDRNIKPGQAKRLLNNKPEGELRRIGKIISYYDSLVASGSHLVSRSPVGFLYKAVENSEEFVLPEELKEHRRQEPLRFKEADTSEDLKKQARLIKLKREYTLEREKELKRIQSEVEPEVIEKTKSEVISTLKSLKKVISAERFNEAIRHGVEERLLSLFAFPDFDEWCKSKRTATRAA
ncbi:MAG: hypothetical protein D6719_01590 [Candidatus Dadabacteria bacterium]|nr:MAG: hypothetical protein D6719_01590 [Candidatus Dadabacteria bacterium]